MITFRPHGEVSVAIPATLARSRALGTSQRPPHRGSVAMSSITAAATDGSVARHSWIDLHMLHLMSSAEAAPRRGPAISGSSSSIVGRRCRRRRRTHSRNMSHRNQNSSRASFRYRSRRCSAPGQYRPSRHNSRRGTGRSRTGRCSRRHPPTGAARRRPDQPKWHILAERVHPGVDAGASRTKPVPSVER